MNSLITDIHHQQINFDDQTVLRVRKKPLEVTAFKANVALLVHTLEGVMMCEPGDYVIRGVKGELYPCARDIFEQTYDEIKE